MFALIASAQQQRQAEINTATVAMAHASLPKPRRHNLIEPLKQLSRWLLDGAAWGLGFEGPQDHPQPPLVGAQPFSGGASRLHRQRRRFES